MTDPAPPLPDADDALLLNAYFDGQLDAAAALSFERRMAKDDELKREFDRMAAVRSAISRLPKDAVSNAFRSRVAALAMPRRTFHERSFDWRQLAASVLIAGVVSSALTAVSLRQSPIDGTFTAVVAEHRRALLAASPVDVESTDRHTVKPWFDAKLALSPLVIDLAPQGFPLIGGRVEVVNGKLVPAMVYRRREHIVSLVAIPSPGGTGAGRASSRATEAGFTALGWHGQDFDYYAVSDIAPDDLAAFVSQWRTAAGM